MATQKITITIAEEQLTAIRELIAGGQADNISAFVQHAVRNALHDAAGWQELMDASLKETGGPLKESERQWADAILDGRAKKKTSGKRNVA